MSCFKRAEWHSGLTYQQTCRTCGNVMTYMDNILDFRPWYPDGFVYCTKCQTPLRHNELYAIDAPVGPIKTPDSNSGFENANKPVLFCSFCGKKFNPEDKFCSGCGKQR